MLLTWLTCGRGGDVLLLKPKDAEEHATGLRVSFWRGKTVKTRGPYTVFTQMPPEEFLEDWKAHVQQATRNQFLFQGVKGEQIKIALRRVNPRLEQRSLRRGALQTLAATNISDEKLLHYSGHTNVTMLRRYLDFGKVSGEGATLSRAAAALVL